MRRGRNIAGIGCVASLLLLAATAPATRAQCQHSTYAYEDRVTVLGCVKTGAPELWVIVLDDASPLQISGRLKVAVVRGFDTARQYKNYLMMAIWDKFYVFDVGDAAHPLLAATFDLKKREQAPGYNLFERLAENKFLVLTAMGALEVTTDGEPAKWTLGEIPLTAELRKKAGSRPPEWRFDDQNEATVVLRESAKYRYELTWREKLSPGEILHQHYLRQVHRTAPQSASELLLGTHLETVD